MRIRFASLAVCVVLTCLFGLGSARAGEPVTGYSWNVSQPYKYHVSGQLACEDYVAKNAVVSFVDNKPLVPVYRQVPDAPSGTGCYDSKATTQFRKSIFYAAGTVCADGTAPDTTKPTSQQCPDPAPVCPAEGTSAGTVEHTTGWRTGPSPTAAWAAGPSEAGAFGCVNKCTVLRDGEVKSYISQTATANGYYRAYDVSDAIYNGQSCEDGDYAYTPPAEPTQAPPETEGRCPVGTVQAGIDSAGIPICHGKKDPASSDKSTSETKVTNPDGSTTTTKKEYTQNSDGSTTTKTTTTTTNADGSTTSSTTTSVGNKPNGEQGSDDSSDEQRDDMCKKYPHLTVCQNSEISGECEQVSCKGDAIQCAIARSVAERNCKMKELLEDADKDQNSGLAKKILAGADPLALQSPLNPANGITVDLPTHLQEEKFLGEGACFPDYRIPMKGLEIVIPFSQVCDYLLPLRYAIMIAAFITAMYIVSGQALRRA